MPTRKQKPEYAIGQLVIVVVEKVFPFGVFVRITGGPSAYIRRRELSWSADVDPREVVEEGQTIKCVVTELPQADRRMELSRKELKPDPWDDFVQRYKVDDVVQGVVRSLKSYGAFVEILPGVNGLVPLSQLATWDVNRPEDVVWEGDDVEAVITHIDRDKRSIRLSIRERLQQLAGTTAMWKHVLRSNKAAKVEEDRNIEHPVPRLGQENGGKQHASDALIDIARAELVGPILVVDDLREITDSMVKWLRGKGYMADGATTLDEVREKINQRSYAVLIVDIDLDGADGLEFIAEAQADLQQAAVAVMSAPEWLAERAQEIEVLGAIEAFPKPLDLDDIRDWLHKIESGETLLPWKASVEEPKTPEVMPFDAFTSILETGAPLADRLRRGLEQLVKTTGADAGMVFWMDPASRAISILAQVGEGVLNERAIYSLDQSPVKDVIRENKVLFENRVSTQAQKEFQKLLDMLRFESCIGVPIETQGKTHHALFLFSRGPDAFHRYRLRDALATATVFSAALERDHLSQHIQKLNTLVLSGQMAEGLSHELRNKLSGIDIQLRNLKNDYISLEQCTPELVDSNDYQEMKQTLNDVMTTAKDLSATVALFRQLTKPDQIETIAVGDVLQRTKVLTNPIARKNKVSIEINGDASLPTVTGSGMMLQQALLNIMLNSVQQIAAISRENGLLEITTSWVDKGNGRPVHIRFSDNGPGIHKQLWDQVFSLGFTTRTDGSGLGLFITRSLVRALGGTISIERSVVPVGTTFLIELPAAKMKEETP